VATNDVRETAIDWPARDPNDVAPRRVSKVAELVAREIVHDIRGLAPNSRLPSEAAMLDRYRVGRGSLREALRILEVQGLIVIRPGTGGGPVVARVEPHNFAQMTSLYCHAVGATYREIMESRLVIEPVLARLAAQHGDERSIQLLRNVAFSPPTDVANYLDTERDFHTIICGMSGNHVLDLVGRSLKIIYAHKVYSFIPDDMRDRLAADHTAILEAIESGNGPAAEALMRKHMEAFVHDSAIQNPGVLDEIVDWH
jgi:DNA-binding FadR family transcriptional regulator